MARLLRFCPTGYPQHIIQRGNNRSIYFIDREDFAVYVNWLWEHAAKFDVWGLMTSCIHLSITPKADDVVIGSSLRSVF